MFDIAFGVILIILSLLGFLKGFVKSFFSVFNWVGASILSYLVGPILVEHFAKSYSYLAAHAFVGTLSFAICLFVLSIITGTIRKAVLSVVPAPIDQSLGFAFGFAKGYAIFALIFAVIVAAYSQDLPFLSSKTEPKDGRYGPEWLVESKSYKILDLAGEYWQPVVQKLVDMVNSPEARQDMKKKMQDKAKEELNERLNQEDGEQKGGMFDSIDKIKRIQKMYDTIEDMDNPDDLRNTIKEEKGYHKKEIEKMNDLIDKVR